MAYTQSDLPGAGGSTAGEFVMSAIALLIFYHIVHGSWQQSSVRRACTGVARGVVVTDGDRIDSVMLVEEGFQVVSTDASDRMLKYALRQRWKRRKEPAFDKWSE